MLLTSTHGDVVFWVWLGASMLVGTACGDGGCEVLAFPNAFTGRRDRVGRILFTPIDDAEGGGPDMTIELLFFVGCPGHERLLLRLRARAEETRPELVLRAVDTPEDAEAQRFLGSPTVRVNSRDVDRGAGQGSDYGHKCRIDRSADHGQSPVPPENWIRGALETGGG